MSCCCCLRLCASHDWNWKSRPVAEKRRERVREFVQWRRWRGVCAVFTAWFIARLALLMNYENWFPLIKFHHRRIYCTRVRLCWIRALQLWKCHTQKTTWSIRRQRAFIHENETSCASFFSYFVSSFQFSAFSVRTQPPRDAMHKLKQKIPTINSSQFSQHHQRAT